MEYNKRENLILELAAKNEMLSVSFLAKKFNVSEMTIRRDLAKMEKKGLIVRRYGGCIKSSIFTFESTFVEKQKQHRKEKEAIAKAIVNLLEKDATIYIDTGSTATIFARFIPEDLNLKIFTANLPATMELFKKKGIKVFVFGGMLGEKSPDLTGEITLNEMRKYRFNFSIIGSDALEIETGAFYSADVPTALLSATAIENSERAFLAIDSSKIGRRSLTRIGILSKKICVVTDSYAKKEQLKKIKQFGAEVICSKL